MKKTIIGNISAWIPKTFHTLLLKGNLKLLENGEVLVKRVSFSYQITGEEQTCALCFRMPENNIPHPRNIQPLAGDLFSPQAEFPLAFVWGCSQSQVTNSPSLCFGEKVRKSIPSTGRQEDAKRRGQGLQGCLSNSRNWGTVNKGRYQRKMDWRRWDAGIWS